WIRMNSMSDEGPVAMGVGGSLDFIAGTQIRAPGWVQTIGMEWFWRLVSQPRRLFKRYSSNLAFLGTMVVRVLLVRLSPGRRTIGTPPEPSLLRSTGAVVVPLPPIRTAEEASAFCRLHEPTSEGQLVVLDLSIRSWLNSLELGVVARLARAAHRRGGALFLTGVTG